MNYGVLDWHLVAFLESRMPPDCFTKIKNEHFHDRLTRVEAVMNESASSPAHKQDLARFFARLNPIRELRNHIAHGHLLVRIGKDGKTPILTLSLPRDLDANDAPHTRHLEFDELTGALNELSHLIEEFRRLAGVGLAEA